MESIVKMGTLPKSWGESDTKNITFCVTEECNLRCKYCYMTGKNSKNKMTFNIAKSVIDYILENRDIFKEQKVIWEFIGGEPFLEIELIDKITDYIKVRTYELNHPWFSNYRLSFSSNGILYNDVRVQEYLKKNSRHVYVGISVDGNKKKHDLQRVKVDGTCSYDEVIKNVPLWLEQFPGAITKATFSHEDLPYLKDSIINLWNLGIKDVAANIIFENVWSEGDPKIYEKQLKDLGDYIIENKIWNKYTVSFFNPNIGFQLQEHELKRNTCGAGNMLSIDCEGNFYPCIRFLDFSLNNREGRSIGDVKTGVNLDKIKPFLTLTVENQNSEECLNCEVATGCSGCTGFNYDCFGTIYKRATYLCDMHKANVSANKYFWNKFEACTGIKSERRKIEEDRMKLMESNKYMIFITSDKSVSHCVYENNNGDEVMDLDLFNKGVKYCEDNNFIPVILEDMNNLFEYSIKNSITITNGINNKKDIVGISVLNIEEDTLEEDNNSSCIIKIDRDKIENLSKFMEKNSYKYKRINVIIKDLVDWKENDVYRYSTQLDLIILIVEEMYKKGHKVSINVLTDLLSIDRHNSCSAGTLTYALAANGKIYRCPAFYYNSPDDSIGSLDGKDKEIIKLKGIEECNNCDAYHCKNCSFLNKIMTNELNISPRIQCIISNLEKEKSKKLQKLLLDNNLTDEKRGSIFS